jgi:aspartyl-tRNA(Asn)/glutamyl-tRNA(Gln) amidotransferase subunit A
MDFEYLTIRQAQDKLLSKEISAFELAEAMMERILKTNEKLHSFLEIAKEKTFAQAKKADQALTDGSAMPLTGIPFAAKDNILIEGYKATAGSKMLENYQAPYTATSVKKLFDHLPVLLGKTNLDEFAMGSSTENSAFGPTKNPFDPERVPGGSSGGSAAAVAAGQALFALGTDTGGSVRQPASFCGIVGLKPTYGRISRYGLVALGSSLDQLGIFTRTVEDSAIVCQAMAGKDELDSTSVDVPVPDFFKLMQKGVKGLRIGIPKEYFVEGMDLEVKQAVLKGIEGLEKAGAHVEDVTLPHAAYSLATYYIILPVEISANLSRYDGIRYGFSEAGKNLEEVYYNSRSKGLGEEPKRRVMIGTYASSAGYAQEYYKKAQTVQKLIRSDFLEVFKKYDLLATPTTPTTAFKLGEKTSDPLSMYLADIFTVGVNLAGVPAISMPVGSTKEGLPIGLQLIAPHFKEEDLFAAGHTLEQTLKINLTPKL